jgi:hypothetical protein
MVIMALRLLLLNSEGDNKMFDFNSTYDFLNQVVGISEEVLDLAFALDGCNEETANNILYWRTGFDSFDSYCEANEIDFSTF